ncbi:MAG TPA: adenylate/guanylate cyclase domain-containing protein [Nevskiaceae bacterium]|nr:adenylate/guanylate cyclase domain-containing protein [Nevskiaceae bacterium]
MNELTPHVVVALMALGIGVAQWSADRDSATSRALALAMEAIGISVLVNVVLPAWIDIPLWATGWLALPESLAIMATLEWLYRVRQTIPAAPGMNTRTGDRLLRLGQLSGLVYGLLAFVAPEARLREFMHASEAYGWGLLQLGGFWLFAVPVLFASLTGLAGILLLLNRRPDQGERIRVLGLAVAVPFFTAGFILPRDLAPIAMVIGEIVFLVGAMHYHVLQGQRGQFLSRFLSPQVARLVSERGLKRAMQENQLEITVVCCDLRGFSAYAQAVPSARVLQVLREYYDAVGQLVAEQEATIKDFAGDGVLILVGAPLPAADHAQRALELARRIRSVCGELTRRWSQPQARLGIGIGLASGPVTVGVIGAASRLEYTAVGSAVNLACRLCEQAEDGEILVAERTRELSGRAGFDEASPQLVKGFSGPVPRSALAA